MASRTDRGVSAVANALTLRSGLEGPALLRRLNAVAPDVFFTAAVPVSDGFRVRRAERRIYRYFQAGEGRDAAAWARAARLFRGRLDIRSFGRGVPAGRPCWRDMEAVEVTRRGAGLEVEVRAPSFVWGMVRKIVGALREHEKGRLPLDRLEAALRGEVRLTLPLAEAEPLVLERVEYPLAWAISWAGPNRRQLEHERRRREELWARAQVLACLVRPGPLSPAEAPARSGTTA